MQDQEGRAWWVAAAVTVVAALACGWCGVRRLHEWAWERGLGAERRGRLPPGDMGFPLIGNMWAFLRAFKSGDPDSFVASFVRRYGAIGMYKAFMFGSPTIMITVPEISKQVLMDDDHFVPGWPKATCELIGKKSFISIDREEHKRLRRLTAAPINGYEALNTYIKFIENTVVSSLEKWASMGQIEFLTELRRFTFKIIMKIFMSSENERIAEALERVYGDLNYGMRAMAINIPGFAYHRALKARKKLVAILQNVLDERKATERRKNVSAVEKDMMDRLMDVEDESGRTLSDEEIIDVLIMYLNAGHESSGHITMWAAVFIQENPEVFEQAKLEQEEIRRSIPSTQKGLTMKEIRKMEYLSKVIDETLRIVSISVFSFRRATEDMYLNGYLIPEGWRIQLWYRTVNLDPQVYPDPKKFDPSRWNDFTPKAGSFLVFGAGSRLCPGNDLAKLEMSVFLHYFLLDYKFDRENPHCRVRYLPHPRPTDYCLGKITKLDKDERN